MSKIYEIIKKHWILSLVFIIGIGFTILIIIFQEFIAIIAEIIQFWLILTAFIILYAQFYYERKKEKNRKNQDLKVLRNRIEEIIEFINDNRGILSIENQNATQRIKLKEKIKRYNSRLKDFGIDTLMRIECQNYGIDDGSLRLFGNYEIGPFGIRKIDSSRNKMDIIGKEAEINKLINSLKSKYNNALKS